MKSQKNVREFTPIHPAPKEILVECTLSFAIWSVTNRYIEIIIIIFDIEKFFFSHKISLMYYHFNVISIIKSIHFYWFICPSNSYNNNPIHYLSHLPKDCIHLPTILHRIWIFWTCHQFLLWLRWMMPTEIEYFDLESPFQVWYTFYFPYCLRRMMKAVTKNLNTFSLRKLVSQWISFRIEILVIEVLVMDVNLYHQYLYRH